MHGVGGGLQIETLQIVDSDFLWLLSFVWFPDQEICALLLIASVYSRCIQFTSEDINIKICNIIIIYYTSYYIINNIIIHTPLDAAARYITQNNTI